MAEEQLGRLSGEDLSNLRQELTSFQDDIAKATSQVAAGMRQGAEGIVNNFAAAKRGMDSLAKLSADELATKKGQEAVEKAISNIKGAQIQSETNLLVLKRQIEIASKDELKALGKAYEGELRRQEALQGTLGVAGKLKKEVDNINKAGENFSKLAGALKEIPVFGGYLSAPFAEASKHAQEAAKNGAGRLASTMVGVVESAKQLAFRFGPSVFLKYLFDASERLGKINQNLGTGIEGAKQITAQYSALSDNEGLRTNTDKLVNAMISYNQELGTSIPLEYERAKAYQLNTEYLGASAKAAARLDVLSRSTGQGAEQFTENLADSVSQAGRSVGVHVTLKNAMEKIASMSSTTLMNLRRTPEALGQAVAMSEKLGMSFDQIRSVAGSLLDFETSIANELEAEVLTGKQLNLERARAAALRGDELTLMREISSQIGTLGEFEKMNVLQREAAAKALGMSADQMGDILLKQDMITKMGKEAENASLEQLKNARILAKEKGISDKAALVEIQRQESIGKRFQDLLLRVQGKLVDFAEKYEGKIRSVIQGIENFIKNEGISKIVDFAIKGLGAIAGIGALRTILTNLRGTPMMPMFVKLADGAGKVGSSIGNNLFEYENVGGQFKKGGGRYAAGTKKITGLKAGGYGAIAGLAATGIGSMMEGSENESVSMAGSALSGAGMGVSMGAMFGPWGMAIGGVLGAGYGLISAWSEAEAKERDAKEQKEKQLEAEEKARKEREQAIQNDYQSQLVELMKKQADRQVAVYMDSNKVSNSLAIGTLGVD
jgi:hypothetical protein